MSEHQYYEFQSIDRKLSPEAMKELRQVSSRASITPRRMINVYSFGDFGGNPRKLVARHFDAFLYWANWGTRELMLKLPRSSVDLETYRSYCRGVGVSLAKNEKHVLLDFRQRGEGSDGRMHVELPSPARLRNELLSGDLRPLYLGWLLSVAQLDLDDGLLEPPVPPGLGQLSPAQEELVGFLEISRELVEVAARVSPPLAPLDHDALEAWIVGLPESEKSCLLMEAVSSMGRIGPSLLVRFNRERGSGTPGPHSTGRTVGSLLADAHALEEERETLRLEIQAREDERVAREKAEARARHLNALARRSKRSVWKEIDALVDTKRQQDYDTAVTLLTDLRELALRDDTSSDFRSRVEALRAQHSRKATLVERLRKADLIEG